jgi:tetratricopeptide (TPR) repeat protein
MPRFSRKPQPKSLADLPRRWDALPKPPDERPPSGPNRLITAGIIFLCLAMAGGLVALWQSGQFQPSAAQASAARAPGHEALSTVLDSARLLMKQSQWARAETVLREAAMKFPEDQETRIALAESLIAQKSFPGAYEQYEKALAIGPREQKIEYAAGLAASSAGLTERAEEHFSMAQAADPHNPTYALMLGTVQRKLGRLEAAKASLLRAVNLDPDRAVAWGILADMALGENNVNIALQHIDHARRLEPNNKEWRLINARALKRKGEPDKALMLLLPMDPSQRHEAPVARMIAECYSMLGRHADAATVMAEACTADPIDKDLAYDAALAFDRAGDKARALDYAKQAKILGHEGAGKLIERLGQ